MKNFLIFMLLCSIVGSIYGQQTYFPLLETGKTWHVVEGFFGSCSTFTFKIEGDTIIYQENFNILYRSNEEFPVNWDKYGYIREDEDKKVYYSPYAVNDTIIIEPWMAYNFGAEINDTLKYYFVYL